jgi:pilus assembly protein CpaF
MPHLDFFVEFKHFLRVRLEETSVLIGRGQDCDVQLPDLRVSRQHARITFRDDESYWIENLSANGTRHNAVMLNGEARLKPGDRMYVADYAIVYQPDDAPSEVRGADDETVSPV